MAGRWTPPWSARSRITPPSVSPAALSCGLRGRSHRRDVVRIVEGLRVVPELEEAALPAEPVRGPGVVELELARGRVDLHPADGILRDRHVEILYVAPLAGTPGEYSPRSRDAERVASRT